MVRLVVLAVALVAVTLADTSSNTITGNRAGCTEEGEVVPAKRIKIKDLSCFTCLCKKGYVECEKERCSGEVGCYMLEEREEGSCCRSCRGCHLPDGTFRRSGETWRHIHQPCLIFSCYAGVVTQSQEVCGLSACSSVNTTAVGTCCPACRGCMMDGQAVGEGGQVTSAEDPCLSCRCLDGTLSCVKRACPVLQCPASRTMHPPGQCCPVCVGNRSLLSPPSPGSCILKTTMLESGHSKVLDACTTCLCSNGTSICTRQTCPVLLCPSAVQIQPPGQCCPACPPTVLESRAVCSYQSQTYQEGDVWQLDACSSCRCGAGGSVRCLRVTCDVRTCTAPRRWEHAPGECCPRCVQPEGICTVFGDPHYRTFDGKFFSVQGSCKYLLAADCVGRSFSIRVKNDARLTNSWAWTKTVALKIGDTKVVLGQKLRVKIDGVRVHPPIKLGDKLTVSMTEDGGSVEVTTKLGVSLLWNGNSFLEVSVPTSYAGHMCGLCGNYNGVPRDDLSTRHGRMSNSSSEVGSSWRVGGRRACDRPRDYDQPLGKAVSRKDTVCAKMASKTSPCSLIKHSVFDLCRTKVNHHLYLKACGMDMCECAGGLCYCESLTAYVRECARAGAVVQDWHRHTGCPTAWTSKALALLHNTIPSPRPRVRPKPRHKAKHLPLFLHHHPMPSNSTKRPPPPLLD